MQNNAIKIYDQPLEAEVKLIGEAKEILIEAKQMKVTTQAEMAMATDVVKLISQMQKEAEKDRLSITTPLNGVLKNINARFKKISEPLSEADGILRRLITSFQSAESRRIQAEQRELQRAAEEKALADAEALRKKGKEQAAQELEQHAEIIAAQVIEAPRQIVAGSATGAKSTLTKRWKARIVSIQKLAQVRPELLMPNMVEINKVVANGERDIPGLDIYQEESVSIR